ncbi:hypothetical protein [Helicobacter suis]|uniref:Uncharacterized protein n=1 Tax=Helicobacter suis TaxID=104628 RepID=A0A6J4CZI7_9HELI|nr:hypothetical protein [Helicobacter suis]BCD45419.1 hypothetical protein NHP190020_04580 [Helicobacter suis]BCD47115.1 hypothetical protein NHP194003_03190 [Helicobacter suis]BCD48871.1 hypothetical protein NHP194004_03180 [Helicobacter suis]BCD70172.1 hypothetical protein SNTW_08170 [Helicobacter suis]GFK16294.1 hypothetical protein NHP190033_04700 [Helicobacter suis]
MQTPHDENLEVIPDYWHLYGVDTSKHYPRITRAAYNPYNPRNNEIKKVEAYVRKEIAGFDITKRHFTFEEKHRLLTFIDQCRHEIAPTLVLHILHETRGAEVRLAGIYKWLSKLSEWRRYFKEHETNYSPDRIDFA